MAILHWSNGEPVKMSSIVSSQRSEKLRKIEKLKCEVKRTLARVWLLEKSLE